jgi:hypothetical protein
MATFHDSMNRPTRATMTFVKETRELSNRIHAGFPQGIAQKTA